MKHGMWHIGFNLCNLSMAQMATFTFQYQILSINISKNSDKHLYSTTAVQFEGSHLEQLSCIDYGIYFTGIITLLLYEVEVMGLGDLWRSVPIAVKLCSERLRPSTVLRQRCRINSHGTLWLLLSTLLKSLESNQKIYSTFSSFRNFKCWKTLKEIDKINPI